MKGQTLFEIVIALAIFSMVASILVSVSLGGFTALTQGGDQTKASALAEEGLEALRSIRDGAWNELRPPAGSQTAMISGAIAVSGNQWVFNAGAPVETIGKFSRAITLEAVCRDLVTRVITVCPAGVPDPHTERATVTISWETRPGVSNNITRSAYITSWHSKTWTQTDWSGGVGSSPVNQFAANTPAGSINHSVAGELSLAQGGGAGDWSQVELGTKFPPLRQLNAISGISSQDFWVVGNATRVIHYLNGAWSAPAAAINPPSLNLRDVAMLSATDGWAVGSQGEIVRCTASGSSCAWTDSAAQGALDTGNEQWNALSLLDNQNGWAVGNSGALARLQTATWSEKASLFADDINDVDIIDAADGWAVGGGGRVIRYRGGNTWATNTDGAGSLGGMNWYGVFMLNASKGWAVGSGGLVYQWQGSSWSPFCDTGSEVWESVFALSSSEIWAIGNGGKVMFSDGQTCSVISSGTNGSLRDLIIFSQPDTSLIGYAVGDNSNAVKMTRSPASALSGEIVSVAFPLSDNSPIEVIEWAETIPGACGGSCTVKFQIQVAPDNAGAPSAWYPPEWMGPEGDDGDETDYFTSASGQLVPSITNGRAWVRYKALLTGDGTNTPVLQEMRIQYK